MQKLIKVIFCILLINLLSISCQKNNETKDDKSNIKEDIVINKNKTEISKMVIDLLKKQLSFGAYAENEVTDVPTGYIMTKDDLKTTSSIILTILNENQYKVPNTENFNKRIYNVFGDNSKQKIIYFNLLDKICENKTYFIDRFDIEVYDFKEYYIFISFQDKLIFPLLLTPEILNYKTDFKDIAKIESSLIVSNKYNGKTTPWKDIPDLDQQRKKNIETLVARNMYLFNDSKAHFKWLILNDEYFMRSLVTTFGYYDDKELLKWVLENTPVFKDGDSKSKFDELSKIFWNKKCDNNYSININLLTIIKELSTPEKNDRIINVFQIAQELVYMTNTVSSFSEIPFKDRAKILAHLLEFGEQYKYNKEYDYNQLFLGRFIYYLDYKKEFITEFKKNNYYDLPNLKKWYELALKEKNIFQDDDSLMGEPDYEDYLSKSRSNQ
ncbi:hypothetical protein SY27_14455 [Flavobacterium sp. 316]|uniref:hypothetical protein n=1 Tax=Flavobacterium sp. 316 TaxID=1603293 RepID=UPI0005DE4E9A|nr:hypothetical protein [Flavobacterium sp. 316]KIX20319.1 hypothetical protein SY27_14455 [Flavobacterium sp. 316]